MVKISLFSTVNGSKLRACGLITKKKKLEIKHLKMIIVVMLKTRKKNLEQCSAHLYYDHYDCMI